jgi:hypothetical protein
MATAAIIRFHFKGENEILYENVPLEEAQEHCDKEWTHGNGWFDGWTIEDEEFEDETRND